MSGYNFSGLSFIVTGAVSGIGRAIAEQLVEQKGCVIAVDRSSEGLGKLQQSSGFADRIFPVEMDLADLEGLETLEATVGGSVARSGTRLAGAVNCAAVVGVSSVMSQQTSDWDHLFAVNLRAPMLITQFVANRSSPESLTSIVHVSSTAALVARQGLGAYASSKAALEQLTKVQAIELAAEGVRVNAIRVGLVDTEGVRMAAQDPASQDEHLRKVDRIPMKREGTPMEIAELAVFLLSGKSSFCTGGVYPIDGGYTAGLALGHAK